MKKITKRTLLLSLLSPLTLFSCGAGSSAALKTLKVTPPHAQYSESDNTEGFQNFIKKINVFASKLDETINNELNDNKKNVAFSPASMFFAFSMITRIANEEGSAAILSALGVTKEELETYMPTLFKACCRTYKAEDADEGVEKVIGRELLNNALFLSDAYEFNKDYLNDIAKIFFTNSFACDFKNKPVESSKAIADYVNQKTQGLLNPNYSYKEETNLVLLNTLFFEDVWDRIGDSLISAGKQDFRGFSGTTIEKDFYKTFNEPARIYECEAYKSMYAKTYNGFKIDFQVPNEGYTVDDLFKEANIKSHANVNYEATVFSEEYNADLECYSHIEFPEFEAEFDDNIFSSFQSVFNVNSVLLKDDVSNCQDPVVMSSIQHTTKVEVKKDTIKGAAATAVGFDTSTAPNEQLPKVYQTLTVDKPFVYTIYNPAGVKLFEGAIYNV